MSSSTMVNPERASASSTEPMSAYISRAHPMFNIRAESHASTLHWDRIFDGNHQVLHVRVPHHNKHVVMEKAANIVQTQGMLAYASGRNIMDCSLHDHCSGPNELCILWMDIELDYDKLIPSFIEISNTSIESAPWNMYNNHIEIENNIRVAICNLVSELVPKLPKKNKLLQSIWWEAHSDGSKKSGIKDGKFSLHAYWPNFIIKREWLLPVVEWIKDKLAAPFTDPLLDSLNIAFWFSKAIDCRAAEKGYLRMPLFPKYEEHTNSDVNDNGTLIRNPLAPGKWIRPFLPCSSRAIIPSSPFICDNLFDVHGKRAKLPSEFDLLKAVTSCLLSNTSNQLTVEAIEGKKSMFCESFVKAWRLRRSLLLPPLSLVIPDQEEENKEANRIQRDPLCPGCLDWKQKNIRWNDDIQTAIASLLRKARDEVDRNSKSDELALAPLFRYIDRRAVHQQSSGRVWTKNWDVSLNRWEIDKKFTTKTWSELWPSFAWDTYDSKKDKWISTPVLKKWLEHAPNCVGSILNACSFEERKERPENHLETTHLLHEFADLPCWERYDRITHPPEPAEYIQWADKFVYHIRYSMCKGDPLTTWHVLMILANTVLHPEDPIEIVTIFQGKEGTGKSRFLQWFFINLLGDQHGVIVSNPQRDLTGNFNSIIAGSIFFLLEEGSIGKNRTYASIFQHLVTGISSYLRWLAQLTFDRKSPTHQ